LDPQMTAEGTVGAPTCFMSKVHLVNTNLNCATCNQRKNM
jgi:hypothetical protein